MATATRTKLKNFIDGELVDPDAEHLLAEGRMTWAQGGVHESAALIGARRSI